MTTNTYGQGIAAIQRLKGFIARPQLSVMAAAMNGEEGQFYIDQAVTQAAAMAAMPVTYQEDGKGNDAMAGLHYFSGRADWYITKLDREIDQHQAFGYADLGPGFDAELGYISIVELVENGVELDLFWEPKTLAQIKLKKRY
jgi:hypothetical protein